MRLPRLLMVLGMSSAVAFAAAACSKSTAPATPSSTSTCSVTLGSTTTSLGSAATTGTIAVTAASTCAWTAQASASFITITSGSSGTGNGSVAYSVAANTGAARSASIVVNDQTVAFSQAAPVTLAPNGCSVTVSPTTSKASSGGGTVAIAVTASSATCSWNATSNSSFLTVPSTTTTGSGTLTITAAANGTSSNRSGTVTVGGQTVTITQDPGLIASFNLLDPAQTIGATTICQIRSAASTATTCKLQSTSFTLGPNAIVSYRWVINYTYQDAVQIDSTSSSSSITFTDTCGKSGASDDGALQPLFIQLTVTDNFGNTATANSGTGSQPALQLQLFNCNR